nr:5-enolpyruvylshikimate-3-phosphate synthase, EPSPS {N-terminal} [Agrobacterium, CP4, glyphosate-tolerant, Peptide Partial, 15 aa] [Agrobacterium]
MLHGASSRPATARKS